MTKLLNNFSKFILAVLLIFSTSCERDLDDLEPATFPTSADVFIDGFVGGLNYAAFGGSDVTAFDTDTEIKYAGTTSMRFSVPDFEDPAGAYAGGAFFLDSGRDLTGYNVLTFWARASQPANIDIVGIGNDLGDNEYIASLSGLAVNTNWKKYYIPIPDPSKLTQERGMFFYSEGPENGRGYTFWIDNVTFENLGTVVPVSSGIFNGEDRILTVETGNVFNADGFAVFNLPSGVDQRMSVAPSYFNFSSSNPAVASVDLNGRVTVLSEGEAVITASLGDEASIGSLTLTSSGQANLPTTAAPTPEIPADDVISIYSNAYTNVPVDFYNGFWENSTTQSEDIQVAGDDVIRYSQLNFVGIQFTAPVINATAMNRVHLDIWTPDPTGAPATFKILLFDVGPDRSFGTSDDSEHEVTITSPTLQTGSWVSIDLPLTDFPGLTARNNLAQVVLSGDLANVYMDNLYLYDDGNGGGGGNDDEPAMAAPTPTRNGTDVISLFSDAYDDVPVDTWRTDWSVASFTDINVAGNATKRYSDLSFVGIETVMNQVDITGMTHFNLDVWSPNATLFKVKLVDFGANGVFDENGGDDVEHEVIFTSPATNQWINYEIPLSDFTGLTTRGNIAQYVLSAEPVGAATIFVDNLYFYNDDGGSGGGDEPTVAAPTPVNPAANVISLFSDAYTDVTVDTYRTDWSVGDLEEVMVAGNATKKYTNLSFVGIETVANTIDATAMTHFRVDIWSADATTFKIKLVDFGANGVFDENGGDDVEHEITFTAPATREWISYDLPLSDFTGLTTRANMAQYILVAEPTGSATIYMDNMYFRN
ncbi:Ig-like domain-containing protein [Neolewinella persica]|uniref:Ig-like domain-containing protein n=1 Tax=Neolewinella persica TaxID=70998 RepID=UPI0003736BBA|nr:Ig-like domain-containing protein [Neolewinella persica]